MSEFQLYEQALIQYEKSKSTEETSSSQECLLDCLHENTVNEIGTNVCVECGIEISKEETHNKEWRYYGQTDTKHVSDPTRVHARKNDERNIYKDVENMGFNDKVVSMANKLYLQVTKGKILRGLSRRSIIFSCTYHSFKILGKPQSHERLIRIFNLSRKAGLKGLKYVSLYAPKDCNIRTNYITPENLVNEIMDKFSATPEQKEEVIALYHQIKNKSTKLNRSRPLSVSSGLIFFWICKKKKGISLKDFASKISLSELTINKIAKEVEKVLGTTDVV